MVAVSTIEPVRFTPSWREATANPPVYLLRAGSVIERGQIEADLAGVYRAARVYGFELREALRAGVLTLLAEDPELDRVIELIDSEAESMAQDGKPVAMSTEESALFAEIRDILAEYWPDYANLVSRLERRREIAPVLAFRRFVIGWENIDTPFRTDRHGQVSEETLRALDPLEMMAAGNRAYGLLYPEADAEKNSGAPSSSDDGQKTSASVSVSKAAGKSRTKSGAKTPA